MFSKKIKLNLFTKIFGFSIFIVLSTLFINYIFNALFLQDFYIYRKKEMMSKVMVSARVIYETKSNDEFEDYIYDTKESTGIIIEVKSTKKNKMGHMMRREMNLTNPKYNKFATQKIAGNDIKILYYAQEVDNDKAIFVRTSLSVIESHSHESNIFNIVTALVASLISLVGGIIFSRRITKDIGYLTEKADKISKLEFPENISIDRDDEIGDLSRNLEKMSNELASSIQNLKSFVSNASHELRTPIAVITSHASALLEIEELDSDEKRKYHEIILKVSNEMKELTENLLTLSKLDSSFIKIKNEELNLKEMIDDSLEKYDIIEFEKDISVNVHIQ
ncbi:MAG: histidine kinase dimerization/phospho-acceptor domain-containing protein, partial [Cetobacterium sp.]